MGNKRELLAGRRDWGPAHLANGSSEPGVARMSQAKRAGPPLARQLGAQSFEDVSGETGRTTSRAAPSSSDLRGCLGRNAPSRTTQTRELRGCLKRNGLDHHIFGRMSLLARSSAGTSFYHNSTPFSKLFGEQARPREARTSLSPQLGGQSGAQTTSGQGIWEPGVARMSQAKRPRPPRARQLGARSSEDVSGETARTTKFC